MKNKNKETYSNTSSVRIDNSSRGNKQRVVKRLEQNVEKASDFVETYGVMPKQLVCKTLDGTVVSI